MFRAKKTPGHLILILDVQSSIVRGSLVLERPLATPVILYTESVEMPYKAKVESGGLIKTTLGGISEVISRIRRHVHANSGSEHIPTMISEVHYVLSSPWIISQAKSLAYTFPKPTTVSRSHVLETIAKERERIIPHSHNQIQLVEEKVCDVRLNGYTVREWHNKETRQFDVSFVSSIADHNMIEQFVEVCSALVDRKHCIFHSSLLLQYTGIQTSLPSLSEYILIHVHGELTDIVSISRHSCTFFASYPFGTRTAIRELAEQTGTDQHAAESLMNMYASKHLDSSHDRRSHKVIDDLASKWASELKKLLVDASIKPTTEIFVLSSRAFEDFFIKAFRDVYPHNRFQLLSADNLTSHVAFDPQTEKLRLTGLYAIAIHSLES